jgi:hypothetical protein
MGLPLHLDLDAIASDLGGAVVYAEPHQTEPNAGQTSWRLAIP